jgi:RNA polymerase sigma factor (sigma-70 family)
MSDCSLLTDHQLLKLLRRDDPHAFRELYERYWQQLFSQSYKRLKTTTAAEEIVQEVFLTLWQKRKELSIESLPNYLSAMTRHAVYSCMAAELRILQQKEIMAGTFSTSHTEETIADNRLTLEQVKKLSDQLPNQCRQVFVYNKINDQSLPEVARKMNISLKTAEAHLTKALRIIRMNIRL